MSRPRRIPKVTVLSVGEDQPAPAAAASLALALLRKAKCDTWDDLATKVSAADEVVAKALSRTHLSSDQLQLLSDYGPIVTLVGVSSPRRTIAWCSDCSEHLSLAGPANPPSKCAITLRCEGTYTKVQPAKADNVPANSLVPGPDQDTDAEPCTDSPPPRHETDGVEEEEEFNFG